MTSRCVRTWARRAMIRPLASDNTMATATSARLSASRFITGSAARWSTVRSGSAKSTRVGRTGTSLLTHRRQLRSMCSGTPTRPGGAVSKPPSTSASRLRRIRSQSVRDRTGTPEGWSGRMVASRSGPAHASALASAAGHLVRMPDVHHLRQRRKAAVDRAAGASMVALGNRAVSVPFWNTWFVPHRNSHGPGALVTVSPTPHTGPVTVRHDSQEELMTTAPSATPAGISAEADALRALYADWSQLLTSMPDLPMRLLRSIFDEWHQPTREPEDVSYREDDVGGVPGLWALPAGADTSQVLLYTHGGGFAVGSAASHRKLAGHVAKALGVTAFVLDYRRAPEHPHPAQLEDGVAAFTALVERGIEPG